MTRFRPYRAAMSLQEVLAELNLFFLGLTATRAAGFCQVGGNAIAGSSGRINIVYLNRLDLFI